jgi:hypothetical protein
MSRWYVGMRCRGRPLDILNQASQGIGIQHLTERFPVLRVEKRARPGDFYLFIAVEGPKPETLHPSESPLSDLSAIPPLHKYQPLTEPFDLKQIRGMTGGEVAVNYSARRLTYHRLIELDHDPFGEPPPAAAVSEDEIVERSQRMDRLLLWLGATGEGTYASFQNACQTLGLDRTGLESRRILRRLRILCHCEVARDGLRWSIAPPVLTPLPLAENPNVGTLLLCGGRDTALLQRLNEIGRVHYEPDALGNAPATIRIEGTRPVPELLEAAKGLDPRLCIATSAAALQLAEALPPIYGWLDTLERLPDVDTTRYVCERFEGSDFHPCFFNEATGFYRLSRGSDTGPTDRTLSLFYDRRKSRWLRGDWYGLRFAALAELRQLPTARFNPPTSELAVRAEARWPELYERALVLASGRLPELHGGWYRYVGVVQTLAATLADKLGVILEEVDG